MKTSEKVSIAMYVLSFLAIAGLYMWEFVPLYKTVEVEKQMECERYALIETQKEENCKLKIEVFRLKYPNAFCTRITGNSYGSDMWEKPFCRGTTKEKLRINP